MNAEEFRRRGKEMIDYVADYLENNVKTYSPLPKVEPGYLKRLLPQEAPNEPESFEELMKDMNEYIMPGITHWQGPNFHAYFTAANSYPAICADILSDGIGCVGFTWAASPACTELEIVMMDWLAKMLQLPEQFMSGGKGGGVIRSNASEATLVAPLAARSKILTNLNGNRMSGQHMEKIHKLVAYCSDQVVATLGTTSCCSYDQLTESGPNYSIWSLKLWFVIRLYGIKGLQQHIKQHVFLAKQFEEMVRNDSRFVVTHKVTLGLVCFRLKDKSNDLNAKLLKRINDDRRIHLVSSQSKGNYFLRFAVCSTKTELTDIRFAWNVITEIATELIEEERIKKNPRSYPESISH